VLCVCLYIHIHTYYRELEKFRGKLPKSDSELEQWCSRASLGAHDLFLRNAVAMGVAYTHDPLPPQLQNALLQVWSACDVCVCVCVCVCVVCSVCVCVHRGGGVGSELGNFCTMRHFFFVLVNVILRVCGGGCVANIFLVAGITHTHRLSLSHTQHVFVCMHTYTNMCVCVCVCVCIACFCLYVHIV
jgi:hypothetical protein